MKMNGLRYVLTAALAVGSAHLSFADGTTNGDAGWDNSLHTSGSTTPIFSESASSPTAARWGDTLPSTTTVSSKTYFVIDHEPTSAATYTLASETTDKLIETTCELLVGDGVAPTSELDCQFSFGVIDRSFAAYINGSWIALSASGVTVPDEDASYTLKVTTDYHSSPAHVKFSVKCGSETTFTDLADSNDAVWFETTDDTGITSCSFFGEGKLGDFSAAAVDLTAQDETIDGKVVKVPEAQYKGVEAIAKDKGTTANAVLQGSANEMITPSATTTFTTGLTVSDAIAIGFATTDSSGNLVANTSNGTKLVVTKRHPTTAVADEIPLSVNVSKPTDSNATITYVLKGSSDGEKFSQITTFTSQDAVKIPTENVSTYRYFKVDVNVTYPAAND